VPPEDDAPARDWLTQVLLDVDARQAHLAKLKVGYNGKFRLPRPHWDRPCGERLVPDPASGFRWFDLLPDEKARPLLDGGPAVLDPEELARLLLNPFGLCDLAERIDAELPPWWLEKMDARGKAWLKEHGIRLWPPRLETEPPPVVPAEAAAYGGLLVGAGLMHSRVALKPPSGNCWELTFGDDPDAAALRRAYAEKLYGDPERRFTFRLHAHRPDQANAPVPFSLEVEPAPTRGPVTVVLEFPGAEVRRFRLEPPETYPGVDAPESFRSARCAPVPADAVKFTTITWGDHPDERHLLRGGRAPYFVATGAAPFASQA
jgi:hypothetical protein